MSTLVIVLLALLAVGLLVALAIAVQQAAEAAAGQKIAEDRLYDAQLVNERLVAEAER